MLQLMPYQLGNCVWTTNYLICPAWNADGLMLAKICAVAFGWGLTAERRPLLD